MNGIERTRESDEHMKSVLGVDKKVGDLYKIAPDDAKRELDEDFLDLMEKYREIKRQRDAGLTSDRDS